MDAHFLKWHLAEVQELLALAEQADRADVPDGVSLPAEIKRREELLLAMAEAKAKENGKKPGGKPPKPPVAGVQSTDQINLTDEESRIMPVSGGGFEQAYNAQAAVDAGSLLVVAEAVTHATNDKETVVPMLEQLAALPKSLGKVDQLLADSGFYKTASHTDIPPICGLKSDRLLEALYLVLQKVNRVIHNLEGLSYPRNQQWLIAAAASNCVRNIAVLIIILLTGAMYGVWKFIESRKDRFSRL